MMTFVVLERQLIEQADELVPPNATGQFLTMSMPFSGGRTRRITSNEASWPPALQVIASIVVFRILKLEVNGNRITGSPPNYKSVMG